MKKIIQIILLLLISQTSLSFGQQIIHPKLKKANRAFAIVLDKESFLETKTQVEAYRDILEKEGLATYIIYENWQNPEQIKVVLKNLYLGSPRLEGAVFVGNIPVPMIRDAQHLTSTFKMDQRIDWKRSSVPSDRFYDDFNLQFDFLKQDSTESSYFYYSLSPESPQAIHMNIYTGRIKPPLIAGKVNYGAIRSYLEKAILAHTHKNKLRNLSSYTGYGYHSESLVSWASDQLALREQLPRIFELGGRARFYNFSMENLMKYELLNEMQRKDMNIFIFHTHGSEDSQLISGYPNVSNPNPSIENVKRYLRNKIQGSAERKEDIQVRMEGFQKSLDVPLTWMKNSLDPEVIKADSLLNAAGDLVSADLDQHPPEAQFVLLDACDNGEFHKADYIAAHYPFSKGNTIVAMANSVGVAQDQWSTELLGLLGHGLSIGNLLKQTAYLETHLFGDPTFTFENEGLYVLNESLLYAEKNEKLFRQLLKSNDAELVSFALKQLYHLEVKDRSALLKNTYYQHASSTVRLAAFLLLNRLDNADYKEVLAAALYDPFELTRRFAIIFAGEDGDSRYITPLVDIAVNERLSAREEAKVKFALNLFDLDQVLLALEKLETSQANMANSGNTILRLKQSAIQQKAKFQKDFWDLSAESDKKILSFNIRTLRAYRYHQVVPHMLKLILDDQLDMVFRIQAMEVIGWFPKSIYKNQILATCEAVLEKQENEDLLKQARKTQAIIEENLRF